MEFYSLDARPFKKIYFQTISYNVVGILASFTLVRYGFYVLPTTLITKEVVWGFIGLFIILSMQHTRLVKSKMAALQTIEDFDTKVQAYQKAYRFRTRWYLFACLISCFLFVVTARGTFWYWAILDLVFLLFLYPGLAFFKRELANDDIVIY